MIAHEADPAEVRTHSRTRFTHTELTAGPAVRTGGNRVLDSEGRVERFRRRFGDRARTDRKGGD